MSPESFGETCTDTECKTPEKKLEKPLENAPLKAEMGRQRKEGMITDKEAKDLEKKLSKNDRRSLDDTKLWLEINQTVENLVKDALDTKDITPEEAVKLRSMDPHAANTELYNRFMAQVEKEEAEEAAKLLGTIE